MSVIPALLSLDHQGPWRLWLCLLHIKTSLYNAAHHQVGKASSLLQYEPSRRTEVREQGREHAQGPGEFKS